MSQVFGDPKRLVNDYMAGSHAIGISLSSAVDGVEYMVRTLVWRLRMITLPEAVTSATYHGILTKLSTYFLCGNVCVLPFPSLKNNSPENVPRMTGLADRLRPCLTIVNLLCV